jgi:hypothetical protein
LSTITDSAATAPKEKEKAISCKRCTACRVSVALHCHVISAEIEIGADSWPSQSSNFLFNAGAFKNTVHSLLKPYTARTCFDLQGPDVQSDKRHCSSRQCKYLQQIVSRLFNLQPWLHSNGS